MKYLFPALCWAVLIGGFGCAKHPAIHPTPPLVLKEPAPAAPHLHPHRREHVWNMETKAPKSPFYFDLDGYALKDTATAGALALYLTQHPKVKVRLEGYCSEEGTDDYNLALGARRAKTVRDYLDAAGVDPARIEWVSFGEENPVTHDPDQFHLNRRVEFTLTQP